LVEFANLGRFSRVRPLRCGLLAAVAGAMMLAGCGQRGPLYLPEQPPKKSLSQPADSGPAPAAPRIAHASFRPAPSSRS